MTDTAHKHFFDTSLTEGEDIKDVGNLAAFFVGDVAAALTGNVEYVDAGYHIFS